MNEAPPAPPVEAKKPRDPVRTITKSVLITLLVLFIYHVVSDRVTPYTSQSNIEVLLVQIAPRIAGPVIEVGAHDNQRVKKGQVLYRIDPEPFEIAVRAAEANLALVQQNISVSTAEVRSSQAALNKQKTELSTTQELSDIVFEPHEGEGAVRIRRHQGALRNRTCQSGRRARRSRARKRPPEVGRCRRRQSADAPGARRRSSRRGSTSRTPR